MATILHLSPEREQVRGVLLAVRLVAQYSAVGELGAVGGVHDAEVAGLGGRVRDLDGQDVLLLHGSVLVVAVGSSEIAKRPVAHCRT